MTKISEIIGVLEKFASSSFSESYDNTGLLVGNLNNEVSSVLITIDVTEQVVYEAIKTNSNLIIAHHPIIFKSLKKLTGKTEVERVVMLAIKNDIAIYAGHTNFDNIIDGVNSKICKKLNLENCKILTPKENTILKLVVFVPETHLEKLQDAVFSAGAGHIGNYDKTSFNTEGIGTFRGNENTNPFLGKKGIQSFEKEIRFETIFPANIENAVISAILKIHPYEEIAYDIIPLKSTNNNIGTGIIGELQNEISEIELLSLVKTKFNTKCIKHTNLKNKKIKKIAVCGGSCSFAIKSAILQNADAFITSDVKYHEFFDIENSLFLLDIGHFESEQYTKELFYEILTENFSTFAVNLSKINTNPINYYC
jgi:dinuclear metal center YbgI/SA1388 family protein